jgi:EmrB/QacA subfamily drug resistance transporter
MSLLLVSMDVTVLNVALPSIRLDFGASVTELQWTLDAYTLTIGGLLMLSGSIADRFGRRRTFVIGLAVFVLGSLLCSTATSVGWLIAFRLVQAIGGSMLNPVAMSIVTATFRDPRERARATGIWSAVAGVSLALGPLVGGALTETVGWRAVFWVNIPLGLAAIVLTLLLVPESRSVRPRRFDPFGQLLMIVLLVSVVGFLIEGPRTGWLSWSELALVALAVAALTGLLLFERRRVDPAIDIRFFRSFPFSSVVVTAILAFAGNSSFLFIATLYLQEVRGLSPLAAGLHMIPAAAMQILFAPISGRLVGAVGTRVPLLLAAVGLGTGAVLLITITPTTSDLMLAIVFAVIGVGQGLVNAPIANTAVSGMPLSRAGSAAAVASTSRQTGAALGVALAGSLVGETAAHGGAAFVDAAHPMWWIVLGSAVVIAALALASGSPWGRRSALAVAPLLVDEAEPRPVLAPPLA